MAMILYEDGLLEITHCPIEDYPPPTPWACEADEAQVEGGIIP